MFGPLDDPRSPARSAPSCSTRRASPAAPATSPRAATAMTATLGRLLGAWAGRLRGGVQLLAPPRPRRARRRGARRRRRRVDPRARAGTRRRITPCGPVTARATTCGSTSTSAADVPVAVVAITTRRSADRGRGPQRRLIEDGEAVDAVLGLDVEQPPRLRGEDPADRRRDHPAPVRDRGRSPSRGPPPARRSENPRRPCRSPLPRNLRRCCESWSREPQARFHYIIPRREKRYAHFRPPRRHCGPPRKRPGVRGKRHAGVSRRSAPDGRRLTGSPRSCASRTPGDAAGPRWRCVDRPAEPSPRGRPADGCAASPRRDRRPARGCRPAPRT
jgi:hypothetical protein